MNEWNGMVSQPNKRLEVKVNEWNWCEKVIKYKRQQTTTNKKVKMRQVSNE